MHVKHVLAYLGVPSVLESGVKSMMPSADWHTHVSPLPGATGHFVPVGQSATEHRTRLCRQSRVTRAMIQCSRVRPVADLYIDGGGAGYARISHAWRDI